jgi:hypothetical protein
MIRPFSYRERLRVSAMNPAQQVAMEFAGRQNVDLAMASGEESHA